ncbi:MAG: hypothetical protein UZ21_OP11001001022 [Microgenomates bacterium OLB22]|nr:MAG: hypothetical protein UZ21_OP11001001022 [Microgenomates bacterium OLB22]
MTVLANSEVFFLEASYDPRVVNLWEYWGEDSLAIHDLLNALNWDIKTEPSGPLAEISDQRVYVVPSRVNHGYEVFVIPDSDDPWSYYRFYSRTSSDLSIELNGAIDTPERVGALVGLGFMQSVEDEQQYSYL